MGTICTLCPSSQKQVIRNQCRPPPPPPDSLGKAPPPPPSGTYSTPCKEEDGGQPRWKSHFSLWFKVGGHGLGQRRMWRPFWAFQRFSTRSDSWDRDQRRLTSALLYSASLWQIRKSMTGQYNQDKSTQAGSGTPGGPLYLSTTQQLHQEETTSPYT